MPALEESKPTEEPRRLHLLPYAGANRIRFNGFAGVRCARTDISGLFQATPRYGKQSSVMRALVVVAARAVHVAVLEFLCRGFAHFRNFHFEVQRLASQRMVAIDGDHVARDVRYHYLTMTMFGFGIKAHARLYLRDALKCAARHLLDEALLRDAVAVFGSDGDLQLLAGGLAFEFALEAGDEVAVAVQVSERFGCAGLVQHRTACIAQRVDEGNDNVVRNLHGTPKGRGRPEAGRQGAP